MIKSKLSIIEIQLCIAWQFQQWREKRTGGVVKHVTSFENPWTTSTCINTLFIGPERSECQSTVILSYVKTKVSRAGR
jgi:hypothetical protein